MILLPVITRELRAEARRSFTHWLRVLGAGTLLLPGIMLWTHQGLTHGSGGKLFAILHLTLFWTIWLVVPVMTADCISREKREGTLGLLFLTPLRARDVVMAKALAHGLRAAALALAALPVLTIPFLYGGVGWTVAVASVLINFSAFCWALGAGVLASSSSHQLTRALVLAALWAGLFFLLFDLLQGTALLIATLQPPQSWANVGHLSLADLFGNGLMVVLSLDRIGSFAWGRGWGLPATFFSSWLTNMAFVAVLSLLAQRLVLALAARNVGRLWQDKPSSPRQEKLEKQFCTPRFGQRLFRGWMRRLIERNPVGWLERRTWRSRLVMWGWLAVMIALYGTALSDPAGYARALTGIQVAMAVMLVTSMAMSAAGSFRRERETDLLELMLVTPLRVGQIVNGRLWALWGQFLPASALFVTLWVFLAREFSRVGVSPEEMASQELWIWRFCGAALIVPVVGLWCSLHCRLFIVALLGTIAGGFVLPWLLASGLLMGMDRNPDGMNGVSIAVLLALLAALVWAGIRRREAVRDYANALLAPFLASGSALLAVWFIANPYRRMMIDKHFERTQNVSFMTLQLAIAAILLVLLHRALIRRKFTFPQ